MIWFQKQIGKRTALYMCKGVRESDCGDEGAPGALSPHGP